MEIKTAELSKVHQMFKTGNDIPETNRSELNLFLNQFLADAIDLQLQLKQAHWNVKGPQFIALHKLFDEIDESVEEYVDMIAERVVQLGGVAEGTVRNAAAKSRLEEYPPAVMHGLAHVEIISKALARFGGHVRTAIKELTNLDDAGTADMFTEISRGIDKWLWFVESHIQAEH